jgi:hypothetical protein
MSVLVVAHIAATSNKLEVRDMPNRKPHSACTTYTTGGQCPNATAG